MKKVTLLALLSVFLFSFSSKEFSSLYSGISKDATISESNDSDSDGNDTPGATEINYQRPFITTWKTDNPGTSGDNQITIPTAAGETYNYTVNWGDGTSDSNVTSNITHSYATSGTYSVAITGQFPKISFGQIDKEKIIAVNQWGDNEWTGLQAAFSVCKNLDVSATDIPNPSGVANLSNMFFGCSSLIGNTSFNDWDLSSVTNVSSIFENAVGFNQPIGSWDVSKAQYMNAMFYEAGSFNQDISSWNVSTVTDMRAMFGEAQAFNQNLSSWDVSNVTAMNAMFIGVTLSEENYDAF